MYSAKDIARFNKNVMYYDGHWLFQTVPDKNGYAQFKVGNKNLRAHRVSYEIHKGPIPNDKVVGHIESCEIKICVNPEHLLLQTVRENSRQTRHYIDETLCIRSHTLIENNVYIRPNGSIVCKECRKLWDRNRPNYNNR